MPIVLGSTSAGTLGTVTLGEVKSLVQAEGYDTDTSPQQTLMVRQVLRSLYGLRRWKFLESESLAFSATVANAGVVDISSLGREIKLDSVRMAFGTAYSGDPEINPVSPNTIRDERWRDRSAGAPEHWARVADQLFFWPIPDATYSLSVIYHALTTLPSADGDTIAWPEAHLDVVVYGVIMRLARRQHDWPGFDRAKASFSDALLDLARSEGDEPTQRGEGDEIERWPGWDALT
jgi:hypothetical protein